MSTWTQALNRLMPNQWALSAINVYMDTSTKSINVKAMSTISYQCLHRHDKAKPMDGISYKFSTRTQAMNRSMPNQWAHSAINVNTDTSIGQYQYQTNGHNPQSVYQNREWLLSRSNQYGVSISTNLFVVYMLQVKVNRRNYMIKTIMFCI